MTSALSKVSVLNDWGILTPSVSSNREAALAILEAGKPALTFLRPLLADKNPALLEGSKEATAAIDYKYRRCDFAYHLISQILGRPEVFDRNPQKRDQEIEALQKELDKSIT